MSDAALRIEGVGHSYQEGDPVLRDIDLELAPGEFLTLLGPSGCGKTTLLRIVGGFIRPTEGSVFLNGEDVTRVPPHKRRVNLVFQRAALFPHLDVYDNLAFGLKLAKVPKGEIDGRVREALELVRLEGLAHRRSGELSGGQAQRVALARALINRPEVLLLDEPLSALDLRIRQEMEGELRRLHRETDTTFVFVTHDQGEALALSDRIALFDRGAIAELGTPREIYHRPTSALTARFVGDANLMPVDDGWMVLRQEDVVLTEASAVAAGNGGATNGSSERLRGTVRDIGFRGAGYAYVVECPELGEPLKAEVPSEAAQPLPLGAEVFVTWDPKVARVLPKSS
jgi:ABC-type Fe3+/spermidine/putrescine transport system ATPase subunit